MDTYHGNCQDQLNHRKLGAVIQKALDLPLDKSGRCRRSMQIERAIFGSIAAALSRGESIRIPHFGTFVPHVVPATTRRIGLYMERDVRGRPKNVVQGVVPFAPRIRVLFRPSRSLQALLNIGNSTQTWNERQIINRIQEELFGNHY